MKNFLDRLSLLNNSWQKNDTTGLTMLSYIYIHLLFVPGIKTESTALTISMSCGAFDTLAIARLIDERSTFIRRATAAPRSCAAPEQPHS